MPAADHGELGGVVGGAEGARLDDLGHVLGRHVGDVADAAVQRAGLRGVDVVTNDVESGPGELDGQRQTDVAEPDDADARTLV